MAPPVGGFDPAQQVRLLLQAIQNGDRAEVLVHLVEIGMWLSITPDPLPAPQVGVLAPAALDATVRELRTAIAQHREAAARLAERSSNSIASVIEHNANLMAAVTNGLASLARSGGFLVRQE
ncbi:MAG TPA: hypothetical protein VGC15_14520 [Acetobacteraceae bacterium]